MALELLQKLTPQSSLAPSTMWGHNEKSVIQKKAPTQPCWHPDLRRLASTVSNKLLVYKLPSLWYFVIAAQKDKDMNHGMFVKDVYFLSAVNGELTNIDFKQLPYSKQKSMDTHVIT